MERGKKMLPRAAPLLPPASSPSAWLHSVDLCEAVEICQGRKRWSHGGECGEEERDYGGIEDLI
jgi:hypothetical protein